MNRGGFPTVEIAAAAYNSLTRFLNGPNAQFNIIPGDAPQFLDEAIVGMLATRRAAKRERRRKQRTTPGA
jgi:hypothetical protein